MRDRDLPGAALVDKSDCGRVGFVTLGACAHEFEIELGRQPNPGVHDVVAIPHIHHLRAQLHFKLQFESENVIAPLSANEQ